MNLNLANPFNEPISFEAMKIAFSLFENASNSDSMPDDIQVLLEKILYLPNLNLLQSLQK